MKQMNVFAEYEIEKYHWIKKWTAIKTLIFPSCCRVSTSVWLRHLA